MRWVLMKTKAYFLIVLLILGLFVAGCTYFQPAKETTEEGLTFVPIEEIPVEENVSVEVPPLPPVEVEKKPGTIEVIEGDLVKLALKATDADGDKLTYEFSAPLNGKGEWQTEEGDAGEYKATVTVSDGKAETSKEVLIVVKSKNKLPVLETIQPITVNEGETVSFAPKATDPDGDKVTITYSGWMTTSEYKTTFDDAGDHIVKITASDGKEPVSQDVKVTVKNVNRAPILQSLNDISVKEGEKVTITAIAADPDKDNVVITYSIPLDSKGEWQTKAGDAGKYRVTVTASDGTLKSEKSFFIIVESLNKAPVIEDIKITVTPSEGTKVDGLNVQITLDSEQDIKTITLEPKTSDADGDQVTVTYSGFMTGSSKAITWNDGGQKTVTVTATDGKETVTKTINIEINRAPQFEI
jgi:uncharacterized protein YbcI